MARPLLFIYTAMMNILQTTYFGPVAWYAELICNGAAVSTTDCFRRQTMRNRCRIATANGVQTLTVPCTLPPEARGGCCDVTAVTVSDHGNWRHLHWKALEAAYGMSPFFDYYADDLRPLFEPEWDRLFDYNLEITRTMLRLLGAEMTEVRLADAPVTMPTESIPDAGVGYYQTFGRRHGFLPRMSILDLLCNEGPESIVRIMETAARRNV